MSQSALAFTAPTAADALEDDVRAALEICGGDPIRALRITLVANAFLEARVDQLAAEVSSGYGRRKTRKSGTPIVGRAGV